MTESKKRVKKAIITIGYSTRTFDDWLGLLRQAGVQIVADIRSLPHSRQSPEFNQPNLADRLPKLGITYHHLKELGGKGHEPLECSPNQGLPAAWQGFADYMLCEDFERGLRRLLVLATIGPVALLCAEADFHKCHRHLIADVLVVRGLPVVHVDKAGRQVEHALTPRLDVRNGKVIYPPIGEQLPLF